MASERAFCKRCRKKAATLPHGWYQLSVAVPPEINERGYIWLGTFCSLACLALQLPDMEVADMLTADLYERA